MKLNTLTCFAAMTAYLTESRGVIRGLAKRLSLVLAMACGALILQACGGGSPHATHLSVTITGTATAGTAFNITVSAEDNAGNVIASYVGTATLSSSDPHATLPGSVNLTGGTATVQVTLATAGQQSVMASDALHALTAGSGNVTVNPAATSQFAVTSLPASTAAGTAFNIVVNATDAYNNLTPSYTGTIHFTCTDTQASLPADTKVTNGTGTFSVTLKTAGNQMITATDTANPALTGTSGGVTVNPGAVSKLTVNSAPAVTTGLAFNINVSAADTYGNAVTTYTGTVHFTSSDAHATLPANSTLTNGIGTFSVTLTTIGSQTISVADTVTTSLKGTSGSINVVTKAATHFSVTGPNRPSVFARATINVTVTALDAANNTSTGYAGTVHFTSSDAQAKLPANSTLTMGTGSFSVTFETVATDSVTATDTTNNSITGVDSVTVTAAPDLVITSSAPPNGNVGMHYDRHTIQICVPPPVCHTITLYGSPLRASGGIPPYTWNWAPAAGSTLPPGLNLVNRVDDCASLFGAFPCIVGVPTEPGTFHVVVTVTDSGLPSDSTPADYTITIAPPPAPVVNARLAPFPGVENQPYSFTFTASGYAPLTWSESGALPAGLMLNSANGTLSGTPTQIGTFPIAVTATDQFSQASPPVNFNIVVTAHGFVATGSMGTARRFHTATLLGNGKVLIAGGEDAGSNAFASAELYDPSTGTFTPTTGNMTVERAGHTATLLNNGKVLITGGATDPTEAATATAELYDPATDTFTATTGPMTAARVEHTATLLQNGKVLIAGGDVIFFNGTQSTSIKSLDTAEIFDPTAGTFTAATGTMTVARESHTATLLGSGKVLIAGGSDGTAGNTTPAVTLYASSETFDPATGQFTMSGMMSTQRDYATANLLSSGKVLVAGGLSNAGAETSADLFDPGSGSFAATGAMTDSRFYHDASALSDGTVLVTGGSDLATRAKATAEIYDPGTAAFAATGSMLYPRVWHTSTLLPNGKVLITGGAGTNSAPVATAELYQ